MNANAPQHGADQADENDTGAAERVTPGPVQGVEGVEPAPEETPEVVPSLAKFGNHDVGNGHRFVKVWGTKVSWVATTKTLRVFDGKIWEVDTGSKMRHLAERVTDFMSQEARAATVMAQMATAALPPKPEQGDDPHAAERSRLEEEARAANQYAQWAHKSSFDGRIKGMIASAQSHPAILTTPGQYDADRRLLPVSNGVIELGVAGKVGFREYHWKDRITQQADVTYEPLMTNTPMFDAFIQAALPKADVRRVIMAMAGLSLVGDNSREIFPFLMGKTGSGKTTFCEIMAGLLECKARPGIGLSGSYTLSMMRPQNNGAPNPQLVRIARRRFVYCSEASDGLKLSVDLAKRFSGGDRQGARDNYAKADAIDDRAVSFTPWLASNGAPAMDRADAALRRRMIPIPFDNSVDPDKFDLNLAERIVAAEGPGVLNKLLAAYTDVMEHPEILGENHLPQEVTQLRDDMFNEMDNYNLWLSESTKPAEENKDWIAASDAWPQYRAWCREENVDPGRKHAFTKALRDAGHGSTVVWCPEQQKAVRRLTGIAWKAGTGPRVSRDVEPDDVE